MHTLPSTRARCGTPAPAGRIPTPHGRFFIRAPPPGPASENGTGHLCVIAAAAGPRGGLYVYPYGTAEKSEKERLMLAVDAAISTLWVVLYKDLPVLLFSRINTCAFTPYCDADATL